VLIAPAGPVHLTVGRRKLTFLALEATAADHNTSGPAVRTNGTPFANSSIRHTDQIFKQRVAMSHKLKSLDEQVIVITGASSGIGLATAETAASGGAKLVLAARSVQALTDIVARINATGGQAIFVECDVSDRAQINAVARAAIERFGRIDTWVNNAGLAIYGRLDEVSEEDNRRLFDINFWGLVNGSLAALPYLKRNGGPGAALINIGSEVSDAYVPLLGMYTASKHAVKGFTDALRVEIEEIDKAPISVTLIQPTATDTPFPQHARNYQDKEPKLPTPMIDPQKVADAILDAAVKPTRATRVGAMAVMNTIMAKVAPGVADKLSAKEYDRMHYEEPPRHSEGTLNRPSESTGVAGLRQGTGAKD
jgi:short-subunit dehydrogenase